MRTRTHRAAGEREKGKWSGPSGWRRRRRRMRENAKKRAKEAVRVRRRGKNPEANGECERESGGRDSKMWSRSGRDWDAYFRLIASLSATGRPMPKPTRTRRCCSSAASALSSGPAPAGALGPRPTAPGQRRWESEAKRRERVQTNESTRERRRDDERSCGGLSRSRGQPAARRRAADPTPSCVRVRLPSLTA